MTNACLPRRRVPRVLIGTGLLALAASRITAQQVIPKGVYGMMAGVMPPAGFYVGAYGAYSTASTLIDGNGTSVTGSHSLDQGSLGPLVTWVSRFRVLGGTYSALAAASWASLAVDLPRIGVDSSTGVGPSQMWIMPVALGWKLKRADIIAHYAFYPPTGRYTAGATDNTSLGMWVNELALRGTWFMDRNRSWHTSVSAVLDINGKKEGRDWTTGDPLTVMYGLGRNFGDPKEKSAGWGGIAGYAQWQVTDTHGSDVPTVVASNKSRVYGLGPEFTTLQGALTIRYFWQFGGNFTTQGKNLYLQLVMPI
jgi:hypothetical protein